jgi:hypothetical protein
MRIARLCLLILLALTTVSLSAAPHKKGGHLIQVPTGDNKSCDYWYQCYGSDLVVSCCSGPCSCRGICIDNCGGPCDWDDSCPYLD